MRLNTHLDVVPRLKHVDFYCQSLYAMTWCLDTATLLPVPATVNHWHAYRKWHTEKIAGHVGFCSWWTNN